VRWPWSSTEINFTTNHTNHHELAVRKTIFTFKFHEIKKEYEDFTANIGVRVRGVRGFVVNFLKIEFRVFALTP
jgi:hypothetical protein